MPGVLTSGKVQKAAADIVRLPMDFGDIHQLVAGASLDDDGNLVMATGIATYSIDCNTDVEGADPVVVALPQLDYPYQISATFEGGTAGVTYNAFFTIVLDDADGTRIRRTGQLEIL